jgi:hypothetical protein
MIPQSFVFGQHSSKKSLLLLIIPSMKTKSKLSSSSLGISSNAFQRIEVIIESSPAFLKFICASSNDFGEKSIVVICPQTVSK